MDRRDMTLYTRDTIAAATSKGNQEKWYDPASGCWYKADAFGYEALAEAAASTLLLRHSNIVSAHGIPVVEYAIKRATLHGRPHILSASKNFLCAGESIVTVHRLLSTAMPDYQQGLCRARTLPGKIRLLVNAVEAATGLDGFGQYLTLLFELDTLILNTDRHLNNIAVLRVNGRFRYCPIFDNGAAFLLGENGGSFDIETPVLIRTAEALPFRVSFARLAGAARKLYGPQLKVSFTKGEIEQFLLPLAAQYPPSLQPYLTDRVKIVLLQQKKRFFEGAGL